MKATAAGKKLNIPVDAIARSVGRRSTRTTTACSTRRTSARTTTSSTSSSCSRRAASTTRGRVGAASVKTARTRWSARRPRQGAQKAFQAKFKDKTKNAWEDRANFKPAAGSYTLIEVDRCADAEQGRRDRGEAQGHRRRRGQGPEGDREEVRAVQARRRASRSSWA